MPSARWLSWFVLAARWLLKVFYRKEEGVFQQCAKSSLLVLAWRRIDTYPHLHICPYQVRCYARYLRSHVFGKAQGPWVMLPGSKEGHGYQQCRYPTGRANHPRLFAGDLDGCLANQDLYYDSIRASDRPLFHDMLTTMRAAGDDSCLNPAELGD